MILQPVNQYNAKMLLKQGYKIRHRFFSDNEFLKIENGILKDENDNHLNWKEYWSFRQSSNFQNGWSIVTPNK